jgi:two-component system, NarL family, sensor histidine kinase UhpB
MYVVTQNTAGAPVVADCNAMFLNTLGYSREQVLERPLTDFACRNAASALLEDRNHRLVNKYRQGEECQLVTHDGGIIAVQLHTSPHTDAQGEITGTRATFVDISQRKAIEERLRQTSEELRRLTHHMASVREEERTSIAREIHDELGQKLTVLKLETGWIRKRLRADQTGLQQKAEAMLQLITDTIKAVQRISSDLRPVMLDNLGLVAAVQWQVQQFQEHSELEYNLQIDMSEETWVEPDLTNALFRVLQEALTNVTRHAQATTVYITLACMEDQLRLQVSDDGIGIDPAQLNNITSFGMIGMRERIMAWGGELEIRSSPEQGTALTATVTLHPHIEEMP